MSLAPVYQKVYAFITRGTELLTFVEVGTDWEQVPGGTLESNEEPHVGVMLPCNVVVQQTERGVEVFAVDPASSMSAIENPALLVHARTVGEYLRAAVDEV